MSYSPVLLAALLLSGCLTAQFQVSDAEKILLEVQKRGYPSEDVARAVLALERVWEATRGAEAPVGLFGKTKENLKIARVTQEELHPLNSGIRIDSGIPNRIGVLATLIARQFGGVSLDDKQFQHVDPYRKIFGPNLAARYGVRFVPLVGVVVDVTNKNAATNGTSNQMALSEQAVQTLSAMCGTGLTPFVSVRMMDRAFFRPMNGQDGLSIGDREGWQNLLLVCGPKLPEVMKRVDELARRRDLKGLDVVAKQVAGCVTAFEKTFERKELDGPTATAPVLLRPNDWEYFKIAIGKSSGEVDKLAGLKAVTWNVYQYGRVNAFLERVLAGSAATPESLRVFPDGDYPALASWLQVKAICGDDMTGAWAHLVGKCIGKPGVLQVGVDFLEMLEAGVLDESAREFWGAGVGSQKRGVYLAGLMADQVRAAGGSGEDSGRQSGEFLEEVGRVVDGEDDVAVMRRTLQVAGRIAAKANDLQRDSLRSVAARIVMETLGAGRKGRK